jgi:DNA-binding NarL/FixJ family response regulator
VHDAAQRAVLGLPATVPTVDLTHTQVAVLDLVAQGLTNSAIAERLHITEDTVSKTINRMAKRLRIPQGPETNTRVSLANRYFEFVGNRRRP